MYVCVYVYRSLCILIQRTDHMGGHGLCRFGADFDEEAAGFAAGADEEEDIDEDGAGWGNVRHVPVHCSFVMSSVFGLSVVSPTVSPPGEFVFEGCVCILTACAPSYIGDG